jgi:hypothetical protein
MFKRGSLAAASGPIRSLLKRFKKYPSGGEGNTRRSRRFRRPFVWWHELRAEFFIDFYKYFEYLLVFLQNFGFTWSPFSASWHGCKIFRRREIERRVEAMNGLKLGDIFCTDTDEIVLIMEGQIVTGSRVIFVMTDDGRKKFLATNILRKRLGNIRDFDVSHQKPEVLVSRFLQTLKMQNGLADI